MLRTEAQAGSLFELVLPHPLRDLPPDLARIDQLLCHEKMLAPFRAHWDKEARAGLIKSARWGRPTIPMATYVRLMVLKHRCRWGYEILVQEVADSLHLRRFCGIPLHQQAPDESTVRKLTRRLGPEVVDALIHSLIEKATTGKGRLRLRAMRRDSTVVEADIRYPTDIGLVGDAVRTLARVARNVRAAVPVATTKVRNRSRAVGTRLRTLTRTLRGRTGDARAEVERLTTEAADRLRATVREARKLLTEAAGAVEKSKKEARPTRRRALAELEQFIARSERVAEQVRQRFTGELIKDRLVSIFDPDARPIRKGKLSCPTQFGSVVQVTELTTSTKPGIRGLLLPPTMQVGNPQENDLLPGTVENLARVNASLKEAAFDGGFKLHVTREAMAETGVEVFITGSKKNSGSRRHRRRLARYRVGCEGRISHLKRQYGVRRSRLKGKDGVHASTSWAFLSYNLHTLVEIAMRN